MSSAAGRRSDLAWRRTALAGAALGLVAVKAGVSRGSGLDSAVGALGLLSAVTLLVAGRARDAADAPTPATAIAAVGASCLLANLLGAVAVLVAA